MKKLRHLALAASMIVIAACATTTPYQAASEPGGFDGYSQTMLTSNKARVTFGGNSLTDRETVENYLLYRSAELALERGFDHFTLEDKDTEKNSKLRASPNLSPRASDPFFNYSFYRPRVGWSGFHPYSAFSDPRFSNSRFGLSPFGTSRFGVSRFGSSRFGVSRFGSSRFGHDPFFNDYDVREITKYRASAEVTFGHGTVAGTDNVYSAREVLQSLRGSIVLPEDA